MSLAYFSHIAAASGGIIYVLAAVLLLALTIIVDRTWALSRMARSWRTPSHALPAWSAAHWKKSVTAGGTLRTPRW